MTEKQPPGWDYQAIDDLIGLGRSDHRQARRIAQGIRQYDEQRRGDVKKLQDRDGVWRLRVGNWRVFFTPAGDDRVMVILAIDNRRDAYD